MQGEIFLQASCVTDSQLPTNKGTIFYKHNHNIERKILALHEQLRGSKNINQIYFTLHQKNQIKNNYMKFKSEKKLTWNCVRCRDPQHNEKVSYKKLCNV